MAQNKTYDIIVIGGGAGGLTAAKTARGFGKSVAIVEKTDRLGGECTWTGCVPSKTLIHAAHTAHTIAQAKSQGISVKDADIDTSQVMKYVRSIVREVYTTHTPEEIEKFGVDLYFGAPHFIDAHTVSVSGKQLRGKKIIITTGSSPFVPPIPGIDVVDYLTNENLFDLQELPPSIIILGGGPIGAEIASALNRLGVKTTIVEMNNHILSHDDPELVTLLTKMLTQEGVQIETGMKATQVAQSGTEVTVTVTSSNRQEKQLTAQKLLVATGRKPNIDGLGLEKIGVKTNKRGIIVNNTLQTSVSHIYACGDVVGPYQFSHMAWYQAVTATRNAIIPIFKKKIDYRHTIWVTFTAPELATAGLTETQAREQYGDRITVHRRDYSTIDRGHTDGTTQGIVKIICDKRGKILGIHILGARAGDIIHEPHLAKVRGIPLHALQEVIHAYPTYAELLWHTAKKAYVDRLHNNLFVRILKKIFVSKN